MRSLIALAVTAALLAAPHAHAGKAEDARTRDIIARYDAAVAKALDANPKLKAEMDRDLRNIATITDPKQQAASITAYQAKYAKAYKAILTAGKVDFNAVAREMKALYPNITYVIVDGLYLVGSEDRTPAPAPAPTRVEKTVTVRSGDYVVDEDESCGSISGGGITYASRSLDNSVWAAALAGCHNTGTMVYATTLPAGTAGNFTLKGDLLNEVFALGIGGGAHSISTASMIVQTPSGAIGSTKSCSVFVLVAWSATKSCDRLNGTVSINVTAPGGYAIKGTTFTDTVAFGVVAGTKGRSQVKSLDAVIKTVTQ